MKTGRIERNGYLEVVLSEIETHRAQGESLGVECFAEPKKRKERMRTVIAGWAGLSLYALIFWYGVLRAIGAL